jgi:hypothetical protein
MHGDMKLGIILWMVIAAIAFTSCQKGDNDLEAPLITIISPEEGAVFGLGDSIIIEAFIEDTDVKNVGILLRQFNRAIPGNPVLEESISPRTAPVTYKVALPPQASGPYLLTISAGDLVGNTSDKRVGFTVE